MSECYRDLKTTVTLKEMSPNKESLAGAGLYTCYGHLSPFIYRAKISNGTLCDK